MRRSWTLAGKLGAIGGALLLVAAALVLGAAADGAPGPLVTHFAGEVGALPVPLMIIPGSLDREAIDRLS